MKINTKRPKQSACRYGPLWSPTMHQYYVGSQKIFLNWCDKMVLALKLEKKVENNCGSGR